MNQKISLTNRISCLIFLLKFIKTLIIFLKNFSIIDSGFSALFYGLIYETEELLKKDFKFQNFLILFEGRYDNFNKRTLNYFLKINPSLSLIADIKKTSQNTFSHLPIDINNYTSDIYINKSLNNFINKIKNLHKYNPGLSNDFIKFLNNFFLLLADHGIMSKDVRLKSYEKIAEKFDISFYKENILNFKSNIPNKFYYVKTIRQNQDVQFNNYLDLLNFRMSHSDYYVFNLLLNFMAITLKHISDDNGYIKTYKDYIVETDNEKISHLETLDIYTLSYFNTSIFLENSYEYDIQKEDIEYIPYFDYLIKLTSLKKPFSNEYFNDHFNKYIPFLKSSLEEYYLNKEIIFNDNDINCKKRI